MTKKTTYPEAEQPRVVWANPFRRLATELRDEADTLRRVGRDTERAQLLEAAADRVETTIERAATDEWLRTDVVAELRGITPDGVRAWCRRSLAERGLAVKRGGDWYVHVDALAVPAGSGQVA